MSGALYETDKFNYGRIKVTYCGDDNCIPINELYEITSGGRIILFIQDNGPNFHPSTGETKKIHNYRAIEYFLIPGLYLRSNIVFKELHYTINPDYLIRFYKEEKDFLLIDSILDY